MKQFPSIEKLDTAILYTLELASSLSILLLAFGLIASMANVLTKGSMLSDSPMMQRIWAWSQCVAIDASVAGTIIRTFQYFQEKERLKFCLYALLSTLLLFTAAIVSNIESVQQTLNLTLENAYLHVFIPVEFLIWIRSVAIVLLIVAHAIRHVPTQDEQPVRPEHQQVTMSPDLIEAIRLVIVQEIQTEQIEQKTLPEPEVADNCERVKAYMAEHPNAKVRLHLPDSMHCGKVLKPRFPREFALLACAAPGILASLKRICNILELPLQLMLFVRWPGSMGMN